LWSAASSGKSEEGGEVAAGIGVVSESVFEVNARRKKDRPDK
jgi:hypothetical protein